MCWESCASRRQAPVPSLLWAMPQLLLPPPLLWAYPAGSCCVSSVGGQRRLHSCALPRPFVPHPSLPHHAAPQEIAPHMMRRRGGLIVMIGSVTSVMASPFAGAYSASKAALLGLTDSLRLELQPFGVQVSYVTAGSIK